MQKSTKIGVVFITALILGNWGSQETTVEGGRKKNKVNIQGTLVTHQLDEKGNPRTYTVDNIAFGKLFEKIPVYAKPSPADYDEQTLMLKVDPSKKFLKTFIDLVTDDGQWETIEIRVDNPNKVWKYKKKEYSSEIEYVEIIFKSNDAAGTEQHYIIELNKKLTCDEINQAGPKEMEVPIQNIKKLTITGFAHRDAKTNNNATMKTSNNKEQEIIEGAVTKQIKDKKESRETLAKKNGKKIKQGQYAHSTRKKTII